jgi:hypothetical protein
MTSEFKQYVFFLSTAEEEAGLFAAQERSPAPQELRYARELRPGTYRVADGDMQPINVEPELVATPQGVTAHRPDSWCTGRVDML